MEKRELEEVTFEDDEHTPGWVKNFAYREFEITEDVSKKPLVEEWSNFVFAHPPHDEASLWCEKAANETQKVEGKGAVLFLPVVFKSNYWRDYVYPFAAEVRIFTCPIKLPGSKKPLVPDMAFIVFAKRPEEFKDAMPGIFPIKPMGWEDAYYKKARNKKKFAK